MALADAGHRPYPPGAERSSLLSRSTPLGV
ncbi:hypothetical protein FHY14_002149 [Xanthomonas arboricola]|nr:hypothetical protein [Xanthomonas arboricola]